MTHLYHLAVILFFPIYLLAAFILYLFLYDSSVGDYTYLEILRIGWRAYE